MLIPLHLTALPNFIGTLIARCTNWTVLDKTVSVTIEVSDDPYLVGRHISGYVRAVDETTGHLLILLSSRLDYNGRYLARDRELVVATPILRDHGLGRLLLLWSAVRIADAASFSEDAGLANTIAIGRLGLSGRTKTN